MSDDLDKLVKIAAAIKADRDAHPEREALTEVLRGVLAWSPEAESGIRTIADAILAAGYRKFNAEIAADFVAEELRSKGWAKPRTISTVEELDALPVGAVVYAANHIGPAERFKVGWMGCGNTSAWTSGLLARDGLPATVLHVGAPE